MAIFTLLGKARRTLRRSATYADAFTYSAVVQLSMTKRSGRQNGHTRVSESFLVSGTSDALLFSVARDVLQRSRQLWASWRGRFYAAHLNSSIIQVCTRRCKIGRREEIQIVQKFQEVKTRDKDRSCILGLWCSSIRATYQSKLSWHLLAQDMTADALDSPE